MTAESSQMSSSTAGYSGTPLAKKLGIRPGFCIYVKNAPANYNDLISPVPEDLRILKRISRDLDIIHFFTKREIELRAHISDYAERIKQNGMIWISWPKKASKVPTDITEDVIRSVVLPMGLVDVKVCAVDEVWSGLKVVIRKELRK